MRFFIVRNLRKKFEKLETFSLFRPISHAFNPNANLIAADAINIVKSTAPMECTLSILRYR